MTEAEKFFKGLFTNDCNTYQALAKKLGVTYNTIYNCEKTDKISIHFAKKIIEKISLNHEQHETLKKLVYKI